MKSINRRLFLKTSATSAAGMAFLSNARGSGEYDKKSENFANENIIIRELGKTGIKTPVVSMGCGRVDSPAVIKAAMRLGINHFDTAHMYQKGNSETLLGKTLKDYPRDSFTIATKIKNPGTKEEFAKMFDESLKRLQMDFVDILYLHSVKKREDVLDPEMIEALKEAKESGKARHIGVSTHRNEPEVIQAAIDSNFYEVVLTTLNFKQDHYQEIFDKMSLAKEKGIGFIAMKVMAGGFLDAEKLRKVNYKAALKWSLQNENVHTTIPSIINLEQLQENASVLSDITLSPDELEDIDIASKETGLYCNGCRSCEEQCTKNLPIPDLMRSYMYAYGYHYSSKAKEVIASSNITYNPCSDCNQCTVQCVKDFNVAQRIKDVTKVLEIHDDLLA
jgi:predicted aldo/keto reductase-like oxidoreductase